MHLENLTTRPIDFRPRTSRNCMQNGVVSRATPVPRIPSHDNATQTSSSRRKLHLPGSTSEQPLVSSIASLLAWLPASANESAVRGNTANHAMTSALYRQLAELHHQTRGDGAPHSGILCDSYLPIDEMQFMVTRVGGPFAHSITHFDRSRLRPMS